MSIELRVALFVGAVFTMAYFLGQIRRSRLQIDYAISWALFSGGLVIISIFPGIIVWLAEILGVMSPANLLYLIIIFVLILKQFTTTLKISKMDRQIADLAQHIVLQEKNQQKEM